MVQFVQIPIFTRKLKEAASSLSVNVQHLISSDTLLAIINAGVGAWKAASAKLILDSSLSSAHV